MTYKGRRVTEFDIHGVLIPGNWLGIHRAVQKQLHVGIIPKTKVKNA